MKFVFTIFALFLFVSCDPQSQSRVCSINPGILISDQNLVCVKKKEGCNQCELSGLDSGDYKWACTELGCPPEPNVPLVEKCLRSVTELEFCEDTVKYVNK